MNRHEFKAVMDEIQMLLLGAMLGILGLGIIALIIVALLQWAGLC